jgi:hypothetical protein
METAARVDSFKFTRNIDTLNSTIDSGDGGVVYAKDSILLTTGFWAKSGSKFNAKIGNGVSKIHRPSPKAARF